METGRYTLILTQGIHTVCADVAREIRAAIDRGERVVDVEVDFFGGSDATRRTALMTSHVVALVEARDARPQAPRRPELRVLG